MSYKMSSILNSRNRDYREWINERLLTLSGKDPAKDFNTKYCQLDYYNCLRLNRVIGRGGGSVIIEANFIAGERCETLFNVSPSYKFAVKLCNPNYLDQLSCRYLISEIRTMLKYSQLFAHKICENFLYCIGFGINCCLLVSQDDLKVDSYKDLKHYDIMKKLNYNIEDYVEAINEEGCDTFILMNIVTGPDLRDIKPNFKLTARQTFEYVYSLLCSVIFLKAIPGNVHLDNFMINHTQKKVVITIDSFNIYFTTSKSIVHIDYQTMRDDRDDLKWSDIFLSKYLHPDYYDSIKKMFTNTSNAIHKVKALAEIFKEYHIDLENIETNDITLLRFSSALEN